VSLIGPHETVDDIDEAKLLGYFESVVERGQSCHVAISERRVSPVARYVSVTSGIGVQPTEEALGTRQQGVQGQCWSSKAPLQS
jgi:hypothetical protein